MKIKNWIVNYGSELYRKIEFLFYFILRKLYNKQGLIIIGCGRSGTTYTSKKFKAHGIDIGHERLKKHGISSWYLVSDQIKVPIGPSFNQIKVFELPVVHQVRHPLKAISSLQATGWTSWKFLSKEIPIDFNNDSKIIKAMKYWYYWNLKAEKKSIFTYQIEKFEAVSNRLFETGNFAIRNERFDVNKKTNTREHISLSWEELENEDSELTQKIKNLGLKYGYDN